MKRMKTWEWAALAFLLFVLLLAVGLVLEQVRQLKTAGDLGIVKPTSQYELACRVLDTAKKIEVIRHSDLHQAKRQAEHNVCLASLLVEWSAWHEIRELTDNQLFELTGPETGFHMAEEIVMWEQRLRPGGQDLAALDREWMSKLPADIWDDQPEDRRLVATQPGGNELTRQRLVESRHSAEKLVKEALALKEQTGDRLPLWVATALLARAEADWLMLWEHRLGLEPSEERLELEAHCYRLLTTASDWCANNYDYKVVPTTPITLK